MSGKTSDLGPTGEHVARAVRTFREARHLGYAELSRRLTKQGRTIPPLGLRRIEAGERRVDVDDLVALALALDVAPVALLLPADRDSYRPLVAGGEPYTWQHIWLWGTGLQPLSGDMLTFIRDSNPIKWAQIEATAADFTNISAPGAGDQ
jgi:transcriptional regulator with XRE-family HTH domain